MAIKAQWRNALRKLRIVALAVSLLAAASAATFAANSQEVTIRCRVMEAMTSRQLHVRLAVFHYANQNDRSRLGALLRQYDGRTVQFQAGDDEWRKATVLRLRTCFGRGLLVFAASEAPLAGKEDFQLRFPESTRK